MSNVERKLARRKRRKMRIRKRIFGTPEKPRLSVYKSNKYLYAQAIDDTQGHTLAALSTAHGETQGLKHTVEDAAKFGEAFGKKLQEKNIDHVVFDRNGNLYHGMVKAVADGTRKAGVKL